MPCAPPPERRFVRRLASLLLAAGFLVLAGPPARAAERALLQGLFDAELWKTDDGSVLLSRNEGDPAAQGRLRVWAAGDFGAGFEGFALEEIEGGKAEEEHGPTYELEQAYLRYSFRAPRRLVIEAGRLPAPIGNFSRRYFSSVNPLIGGPDGYQVSYPTGFQITGGAGRFDYRVAGVDLPLTNENYVPAAGRALRPALAFGLTPTIGLRLGAYYTRGPYLNDKVSLPPGAGWKDFAQEIAGFDLQFSRGYFELNGDFNRSSYEVPGQARMSRGAAWFVEPKYTFSPRFFAALRVEENDYAYIAPAGGGVWFAGTVRFYDVEAGVGYRIGPGTVLKLSYRADRWQVADSLKPILPDGYAVAAQLSHTFDVGSWFKPRP